MGEFIVVPKLPARKITPALEITKPTSFVASNQEASEKIVMEFKEKKV